MSTLRVRILVPPIAAALLAPIAAAQPASQVLEMWGARTPPPGTVTSLDLQGVVVMLGDGTSVVLGWDQVREVTGPRREQFGALREDARAVWRAGVRLARGDLVNAEPLLEDLFARSRAQSGATSSMVARGLLRCRLGRGARASAVEAWLGALRAERWAPGGAREPGGPIEPETGLAPAIAPVWLGDEQSQWLARQNPSGEEATRAGPEAGRQRISALDELYRISAAFEASGGDPASVAERLALVYERTDPELMREAGLGLVHEIVLSRVGDREQRASARRALEARLGRRPEPWREAWVRVAIGRSLIIEQDSEQRRRGVLQLLHVPARLGGASPTLASIALAHSAITLREMGDGRGAATLRRELLEKYPESEGARWAPIVEWGAPAVGSGGAIIQPNTAAGTAVNTEGNERS